MSIDSAIYRQVLGHFPTGVTVITGIDTEGEPSGLTIGSFTSVSLDPPLVGFLPAVTSKSWPAIQPSGAFCVNVLGHDQADLCWRFAKETEGRYTDLDWTPGPTGSPVLAGVAAWIDCTIEHVYEMGDHLFVLGRVQQMAHADEVANAMVFFRGKVGGFGLVG